MKNNIWLILEKSDETRVSSSIVSYKDRTGEVYNYDSLVPNNKQIAENDFIIIRKENDILGLGRINEIKSSKSVKTHKRCPKCDTTDIRLRNNRDFPWRCGRCQTEFKEPQETKADVISYAAEIVNFNKFDLAPTVFEVKSCAYEGISASSQNSIMRLDINKVSNLLSLDLREFGIKEQKSNSGQGIGLTYEERRVIELRAMEIARDIYLQEGWTLLDTSTSEPYDFEAYKGKEIRYIEVKGTTGDGASVILTHGEVKHVFDNPETSALVVISNIKLDKSSESPSASEGKVHLHLDPWIIDEEKLTPTPYRYLLNS